MQHFMLDFHNEAFNSFFTVWKDMFYFSKINWQITVCEKTAHAIIWHTNDIVDDDMMSQRGDESAAAFETAPMWPHSTFDFLQTTRGHREFFQY